MGAPLDPPEVVQGYVDIRLGCFEQIKIKSMLDIGFEIFTTFDKYRKLNF